MNAAKRPQRTSGACKDIVKNLLAFSTFSREAIEIGYALTRLDDVLGENRSSEVYVKWKSRWR